jgi:hypothetical protein
MAEMGSVRLNFSENRSVRFGLKKINSDCKSNINSISLEWTKLLLDIRLMSSPLHISSNVWVFCRYVNFWNIFSVHILNSFVNSNGIDNIIITYYLEMSLIIVLTPNFLLIWCRMFCSTKMLTVFLKQNFLVGRKLRWYFLLNYSRIKKWKKKVIIFYLNAAICNWKQ